jgi:glycosyltransferase involved in cell wall biosynthesis
MSTHATSQFSNFSTTAMTLDQARPLRILHVVENLHNQAIENWLLRMLRASSSAYPHHEWSLFCILGKEGCLDSRFKDLGASVIHSQCSIGEKRAFLENLREIMKDGGYDILHCHHDIISAMYLVASIGLPFRKRIVHVHNTELGLLTPNRTKASVLRPAMREICLRLADQIVGISGDALAAMLAGRKPRPKRDIVVHYGVDTHPFADTVNREAVLASLEIPDDSQIVLFVGRLDEYKNPTFVLEVLSVLARSNSKAVAVFAGAGAVEQVLQERARELSLTSRTRLLGFRNDVPKLMQAADVLLWPSIENPKEGLGLGVIEAQAAGLPVLMSLSVPDDAIVIPELVSRLSLSDGPAAWAQKVGAMFDGEYPSPKQCLARFENSSFGLSQGVTNLMELYDIEPYGIG